MDAALQTTDAEALRRRASELVHLEAYLLDARDWDGWLDLYAPDASYWIPAWIDEHTVTSDPMRELSLIYYPNRTGLEDRVFRVRTEKSLSSSPLPRTSHLLTVTRITDLPDGDIQVDGSWAVHVFRLEKTHCFFGQQTHVFRPMGGDLKVVSRRTVVNNDVIPDVLDFYSV